LALSPDVITSEQAKSNLVCSTELHKFNCACSEAFPGVIILI